MMNNSVFRKNHEKHQESCEFEISQWQKESIETCSKTELQAPHDIRSERRCVPHEANYAGVR